VPRWLIVFGQVNHIGAKPSTQAYQPEPTQAGMSTRRKLGD